MADRIEFTPLEVPPDTLPVDFVRFHPSFDDGIVVRIEMRWPPGPSGLVGLRIGHSGQVIIPRSGPDWLITDDESVVWDLSGYPTANAWFVDAYNTDVNFHTIQMRWLLNELTMTIPPRVTLVPIV
jgi:hypothetical protein